MKVFQRVAVGAVLALFGCLAIAQDETDPTIEEIPEPPKWERSLDFGLSGASGNTDTQDIYASFKAHKATDRFTIDLIATYRKSESDGDDTDNRLYTQGRYTWLFADSKWGLFAQGSLEIDRFKSWDERVTGAAGPSYRFIGNDKTFLEGRVGFGFVAILGGDTDDEVDPELILGSSCRHKFNDQWSLTANAELLPNLNDTSEYRFLGDVGIEYSLAESWSIKAGIEEVFDSDPGAGTDESDFYYFLALSAKF